MRRGERSRSPAAGYSLVALVVIVAVMSVLVAAALPYWSQVMQRDREAELIFRGLQYAEAIRVFQLRFGRYPNTVDELIDVNPRSIRRLWKDPMTEDGAWDLIRGRAGRPRQGSGSQQNEGQNLAQGTAPTGQGEEGRQQPQVGPIIGVRSRSKETAVLGFLGGGSYSDWQFTVDLIPAPVVVPGSLIIPRPTSDWVGRPFRPGLEAAQGGGLGGRPGEGPEGRPQG